MTGTLVTCVRAFVNLKPVLSGRPRYVCVPLTVASTRNWPAARLALNVDEVVHYLARSEKRRYGAGFELTLTTMFEDAVAFRLLLHYA